MSSGGATGDAEHCGGLAVYQTDHGFKCRGGYDLQLQLVDLLTS